MLFAGGRAVALAAALVVGACSHPVVPTVAPVRPSAVGAARNMVLPGRWFLVIDAAALDATLQP